VGTLPQAAPINKYDAALFWWVFLSLGQRFFFQRSINQSKASSLRSARPIGR
jgi:hypothetical protein